jgi:nucleotide-binding universal stress UspA family protein
MSWILVPVDFSTCATLVVREACRFADAFGAGLLLFHAAEAPRGLPLGARIQPPGLGHSVTVAEWLLRDAESQLQRLAAEAGNRPVRWMVRSGHVVECIQEVAASEKVEMIVMGTHGRRGAMRVVLGSVAEEVVRTASVPVLTLRNQHRPDCKAASCAACLADRSPAEQMLVAETEG